MQEESFSAADLWPAEARVVEKTARGEWAELSPRPEAPFSHAVDKPVVRAAFLRHLLLGLPVPVTAGERWEVKPSSRWFVSPTGVRVIGATIVGRLELKDAIGAGGASLCALALEHCDIAEDICLDHAYLQRLSLRGSRLRMVSALEVSIAGQVDLAHVHPHMVPNTSEQCWLNFDGARIDGDFRCAGAWLKAPPPRMPVPADHRGHYALSLREAEVEGRFFGDSLTAIGGVSLSFSSFRGEVWLSGATFIKGEKNALSAEGVIIHSNLKIDQAGVDHQPFTAKGCVWLLGAKVTGNLVAFGGQFLNPSEDGSNISINAQGLEVGGSCAFKNGFRSEGQVKLNEARIAGNLDATGGLFLNRTENGFGRAIRGRNVVIGGSCFLNDGFRSEGEVRLNGVRIAGNLDATNGHFLNGTPDGQGAAIHAMNAEIGGSCFFRNGFKAEGCILFDGSRIAGNFEAAEGHFSNRTNDGKALAFSGKNVEIGGYCFFTDGFLAEGEINLADAKIAGNLSGRGGRFQNSSLDGVANALYWHARMGRHCLLDMGFKVQGNVSLAGAQIAGALVVGLEGKISEVMPSWNLTDARVGKIEDKMGLGWGGKGTRLILDGLSYDRIDSTAATNRDRGEQAVELWSRNPFRPSSDFRHRLQWFKTYVEPRSGFSPQPYEKLAMVFKATGLIDDARKILRHSRWRQWRTTEPILSRIFTAPFGICFGFGYSPPRAFITFILLITLGGYGTDYANRHGLLVIDTIPVATVLNESQEPSIPLTALPTVSNLPCGNVINPYLYAADIFIPLVDLRQETLCEPIQVEDKGLTFSLAGIHQRVNTTSVWVVVKSAYALLGALITSLLILTFSGVLQEKGNKGD